MRAECVESRVGWRRSSVRSVSFDGETARLFNSLRQLFIQFIVRFIGRDIYPIETGVSFRQVHSVRVDQVYREMSRTGRTRRALQCFESYAKKIYIYIYNEL